MALYKYRGFSRSGKETGGTLDAPSPQAVREQLGAQGIFLTAINLASEQGPGLFEFIKQFFKPRISVKEKIFFSKQLAVLLKSGVPLLQALDLLVEQSEKGLRSVVISLRDAIREGQSLADSLARFPAIFDVTYVQLIRAGEASGKLTTILERLTEYLERSSALTKRIRSALTLPIIQLCVVIAVVSALLIFVVPEISQAFESQGVELPLTTRTLLALSNFAGSYYLPIIIALGTLIILFLWWRTTAFGARTLDRIALRLPLIRYFSRTAAVVQFSRTLGMLIEGGVNLAESLHIVCNVVHNRVLVDALNQARENIIKQGKVAEYLKRTGIFPAMAIYLIKTGEESGHLDSMLLTVANHYDTELTELIDSLTAKLSPLMVIIMGGVVGFIVMAIGSPLMQMNEIVSVNL